VSDEIMFQHGTILVRRLSLAPGEAMPWHQDPFQRVAVVVRGDLLLVEFCPGGESRRIEVTPGQIEWEQPTERIHRAVNVGKQPYEQVTVFLLDRPDVIAQPNEE
jgi:quercetin dioxygenase-like cupin family protein